MFLTKMLFICGLANSCLAPLQQDKPGSKTFWPKSVSCKVWQQAKHPESSLPCADTCAFLLSGCHMNASCMNNRTSQVYGCATGGRRLVNTSASQSVIYKIMWLQQQITSRQRGASPQARLPVIQRGFFCDDDDCPCFKGSISAWAVTPQWLQLCCDSPAEANCWTNSFMNHLHVWTYQQKV